MVDLMEEIFEKIFQQVTGVVLGKRLTGMQDYEAWLMSYVSLPKRMISPVSGEAVYVPPTPYFAAINKNLINPHESPELGKLRLTEEDVRQLTLKNAGRKLANIKYLAPAAVVGKNTNILECCSYADSHYCLRSSWLVRDKYVAYCFWPRETEYALGCSYLFSSRFCIKCHNSENLNRCFELNDSNSCSDCYFCHNCENLNDCMFCFNTKSKRYAIANVEIGREKYLKIKQTVLGELVSKLEKNKSLGISIFNLG